MTCRARLILLAGSLVTACASPAAPTPPILLTITPGTNLLRPNATEAFTAFVVYSDGAGSPVIASWASDNVAVVNINGQGVATAVTAGIATITATYDGATATRSLRVVPSYAGNWVGGYRTLACSATVAANCLYTHAPGATSGSAAVYLTQLVDQVTGFVYLDSAPIPVSGSVARSGELTLQGALSASDPANSYVIVRLESWTTSIDAASRMLVGRFSYLHDEWLGPGSPHLLSNRVDSELLNVRAIGPP